MLYICLYWPMSRLVGLLNLSVIEWIIFAILGISAPRLREGPFVWPSSIGLGMHIWKRRKSVWSRRQAHREPPGEGRLTRSRGRGGQKCLSGTSEATKRFNFFYTHLSEVCAAESCLCVCAGRLGGLGGCGEEEDSVGGEGTGSTESRFQDAEDRKQWKTTDEVTADIWAIYAIYRMLNHA